MGCCLTKQKNLSQIKETHVIPINIPIRQISPTSKIRRIQEYFHLEYIKQLYPYGYYKDMDYGRQ